MKIPIITAVSLAVVAAGAGAQEAAPAPGNKIAAISSCISLAGSGKLAEAAAEARAAEADFRSRVTRNPRDVESRVGLAQLLSQCILPSAEMMQKGELSAEALELLDQAIELQPDHWLARFVLANISDQSPPFLGRRKRAAQEYDILLRMQGDRNDNPLFARVFVSRGRQLSREGQVDSARVLWSRGLTLFPNDTELQKLNDGASSSPLAALPSPSAPQSAATPTLSAVEITASAAPRVASPSMKSVSRSEVLLTAGGAADVFQAVQMQPGATRVNEGGDVYTRGGDASETALVVNGGRLVSLGRFEGLSGSMFGALEPFVVRSVRYSSGGFSVKHGNSLSGVLEIETDGRPREQQKRFGLSLVQASGTIRSPLASNAGGWLSARLSHTGALLRTHGRTGEFTGAPRSAEIVGSIVMNPTPLTEVSATVIAESDESRRNMSAAGWRGSFDSRGDKQAVVLRSRWISESVPLVVRANLTASNRTSDWNFGVLSRERDERNGALRVDAEWEPSSGMLVRAGVEHGKHYREDAGSVPTAESVAPDAPFERLSGRENTTNAGSYVEGERSFGRLSVTTGIRTDRLAGESELTVDPRVAFSVQTGNWTTRFSGGLFHQGRWRGDTAIPDAGTPSGLPRLARHLVLGVERNSEGSLVKVETFVKQYDEYRTYGSGPAINQASARGIEILAQRAVGKLSGWVGYSLLDATSTLESGARVRSAFDITHSATASLTATVKRDWSIGTTVRYGTGAPYSPVVGSRTGSRGRIEPMYGELMSHRLPAYTRIDSRLMRYVPTRAFMLTTFAEVLNVTGRRNVASYTWDANYTRREPVPSFFSQRTFVIGGEVMLK